MPHAAEFHIEIAANEFHRHLFAGVAFGKIDFAEAAATDASLDRISFERPGTAGVHEFHRR